MGRAEPEKQERLRTLEEGGTEPRVRGCSQGRNRSLSLPRGSEMTFVLQYQGFPLAISLEVGPSPVYLRLLVILNSGFLRSQDSCHLVLGPQ